MKIWPTKKLGEVIEVIESGSRPKGGAVAFGIPSLGVEHINDDGTFNINTKEIKYVPESFFKNLNRGRIKKFDILIAKDGATTGKTVIVSDNFPFDKASVNEHLFIIRGNPKVVFQKFLFYTLFGPKGKKQILKTKHGAAQGGIDQSFINVVKIPLPPIATQTQIVERLDKIAEAQKLNDELIQKSDELFQSLLHQELNPAGKDWGIKKLSEVGEIVTGTTPSTKNSEYWNGEFLWATPTDIKENTFILTDTPKKLSREGYEKTRPVPKNAILVTCIASIGKMTIAGKEMATNQQINSIVCNKENDPFFVFFSLQKDKKKLISLGKTTAVPIINKSEFGRIKIPLPPLKIQKQIVAKLSAVQEYKGRLLDQRAKLKELFESALHNAFRGSPR